MNDSVKKGAVAVALGMFLLLGCGKRQEAAGGVTDTNTNWLKSCESDSVCGDLQCLCGVCTIACERNQECSHLADEASCQPPSRQGCSAQLLCGLPEDPTASGDGGCSGSPPACATACGQTQAPQCEEGAWVCSELTADCSGETDPVTSGVPSGVSSLGLSATSSEQQTETSSIAGISSVESVDTGSTDTMTNDCAEGTPCDEVGLICGEPCTDACQFCNRLYCSGSVWQRVEAFPAPCFDCGETMTCNALETYCHVDGGMRYSCEPYPTECVSDRTCSCLESQMEGVCTSNGEELVVETGTADLDVCSCAVWYSGSDWCDAESGTQSVEWVCDLQSDAIGALNTDCEALPTTDLEDQGRWCCSATFTPVCE